MKRIDVARGLMIAAVVAGLGGAALAQTPAPATPPAITAPAAPPAASPPATPAPATPTAAPTQSSAPQPAAPQISMPAPPPASPVVVPTNPIPPAAPDADKPSGDASTAQTIDLPGKPAAVFTGRSNWEDGFASLTGAFKRVNDELTKNGLKPVGRPLAIFLETDDNGFRYEAMVLLAEKPAGKDALGNDVKIGLTPSGKAMKFQHRGAYDDIDSTYEAITAYLDEKNLESRNLFIEEYLNDPKTSDDVALEVDIYVFVK